MSKLDDQGREIPDDTKMAIPAGFKEPEPLESMIRRLVRSEEWRRAMDAGEADTFEEAEDFIIEDDFPDPSTAYEEVFDPALGRAVTPEEVHKNAEVYRKRYLEAEERARQEMLKSDVLRYRPSIGDKSGPAAAPNAADGGSKKPVEKSE